MTEELKVLSLKYRVLGYTISVFIVILIILRLFCQKFTIILQISPFGRKVKRLTYRAYKIIESNSFKKN